jgi:hypothetical protein
MWFDEFLHHKTWKPKARTAMLLFLAKLAEAPTPFLQMPILLV